MGIKDFFLGKPIEDPDAQQILDEVIKEESEKISCQKTEDNYLELQVAE